MAVDYNISTTSENDKEQIIIEGNLTLKNADKIKDQLLKTGQNGTVLEINIKNVSDLDLSFLQILLSLTQTLKDDLEVTMSLSDEHNSLIKHAGFFELINNKHLN